MKYYIVAWIESNLDIEKGSLIPIYLPKSDCSEELIDDDFLFEGELNSLEFDQHFYNNIIAFSLS